MELYINGKKVTTPEEIQESIGGNYNQNIQIHGSINVVSKKKDSKNSSDR